MSDRLGKYWHASSLPRYNCAPRTTSTLTCQFGEASRASVVAASPVKCCARRTPDSTALWHLHCRRLGPNTIATGTRCLVVPTLVEAMLLEAERL